MMASLTDISWAFGHSTLNYIEILGSICHEIMREQTSLGHETGCNSKTVHVTPFCKTQ